MKKNSTPPTKKQDYNANSTTQDELNKKVNIYIIISLCYDWYNYTIKN